VRARYATGAIVLGVLAVAAAAGWVVFGRSSPGRSTARVAAARTTRRRPTRRAAAATYPAARALGLPPVVRSPVPGYVLIADRNNDRLLVVSPDKRVVWRFPRPGDIRPGQSFHDPDDAFFTPGYRGISTNEEFNQQIAEISLRSRRIFWSYGQAGVAGSGRDELSNPDDAYALPNGQIMVADIQNCRVLRIDRRRRIVGEIGSAGRCAHDPPNALLAPNGATPLPDGGTLVTEIGGYIDRIDAHRRLLWSIRSPTSYPSDAQLLPNGNVLVAGFNTPGRVDILRPDGRVVWTYAPQSGPGSLDRPSLAVRWPNGMIAVTDDWHHRIVVIDPKTKRIVWQYGHLGVASSATGYLSKPDGLDLLPAPAAATVSRRPPTKAGVVVRRVGSLPASVSRLAATVTPDGRVVACGGLVGGSSSEQILLGSPAHLRVAGHLPAPTHDAAAAPYAGGVAVFGGGEATSTSAVFVVDPRTGRARALGHLDEPLSDLGAATVAGRTYLVGGYTGSRYATAVLRVGPGTATTTVARLPVGLRYAGVAAYGGRIYVAGGVTTSGETRAVYAVDPARSSVSRIARLPFPAAHAPLVAVGDALYLFSGTHVVRIDPRSGTATVAGSLPAALHDAAAVAVAGHAYVLGGGTNAVYELSTRA
jgi:hypothetical protein